MDKGTQPAILSNLIAATVSDSSLSSVDTNPGSNLLPTVTAIADQVNDEIRQNHPEYLSRLPIVDVQRDEITIVDDKSSNISSEPSCSSIQPNNDLTNCFKRSLLNESFNIENIKKCRLTENIIEGQSNMSNLKSDLYIGKNENDKIVPSIKIKIENSSDCKKLSENIVCKDVNVKIEMNKNVKKEIFAVDDAFNLEKFDNSIEFPDDKSLYKSSGSKNTTQSVDKKNNTGISCKVEFNTEIGQNDKITNELVLSNKTVNLDHQYSKSSSPENMVTLENVLYKNKGVNKVPELTEKIGSFQTNNKINKSTTPQESEINRIENNDDKDLQESVINEEYINYSIMENSNLNQKNKSGPVDTTNEIPITVNEQGISKLKTKFPIFNLLDDEGKGELIQSITDFSKIIHPEIEELLKDDSVTFEDFDKCVEENISRLMNKEFDKQLKSITDNFIHRTDVILQDKYDTIKLQLKHANAIVEKHDEELKTDVNSIPRKIRRHIKVQTKRYNNKTSNLSTQASNSDNQNDGSLVVITDSPLQCSSVIAPKVISVKTPKILNVRSLPPVPPAIPIDDDLAPLSSVHHQKCHTFKPITQAPIMKTANKKSLKVVTQEGHSVILNTLPVETINLPPKPLKNKDPSSSVHGMPNRKGQLLPEPTLTISVDSTSEDEDCIIIDSQPMETINLLSPEPLKDDGPTPISDISKKKHIRVKKQLLPAPTLIILDEDSSDIAQGTQIPNIHNPPTEFVNLLSPEPVVPIEESNINVLALQNYDSIPGTSSMPILPLPAEPIQESNIYVPVHHSADPLPNISSTLVFAESSKKLMNNLSVLNIDDPLASTLSMPILPLPAELIEKTNIDVPMQHNIAPLPGIPIQKSLPSWKPLPPAPQLKISNNQTSEDIELIWDIETNGIEQIKSFEVYCYNEVSPEMPTSVDAWQKSGDVEFLPLPIKCCLKKGTRNIMCHYTVRAVDVHDRVGPFSIPESIFIN